MKIGNTTSYIFAVKQTSARSTAFQNLTIEETEKGTKAFVTTYFPSKKWISDYRSGIKSTFDGKLVFTRINISGQPDKNAQQAKEMERLSSLNPAKSSVVSLICETYTVYEYTAVPCSGLLGHMPGEDCPFYDDPTQGTPPSYAFVPVEYEDCYEYNSDDPGGNTTPTIPDPYDPCGGGPIASFIPFEKGTRLATVPPSDCDGNGGGGVEEPPLEVINDLKDPCKIAAHEAISNQKINNLIAVWYNKFFVDKTATMDIQLKEGANITVNNQLVPAYTAFNTDANRWETTLSSTYFAGNEYHMSKEAYGQIIVHEILHTYISKEWPEIAASHQDHLFIFKNLVNPTKDLLKEAFGMSEPDALGLALNGIQDNWKYTDFESLCSQAYGLGLADVKASFDKFTKGTGGTKCSGN